MPQFQCYQYYKVNHTHLASLNVRCLSNTLEPKVRASMSSVPVAYTLPAFTRAEHWASASHGAFRIKQESFKNQVLFSGAMVIHCSMGNDFNPFTTERNDNKRNNIHKDWPWNCLFHQELITSKRIIMSLLVLFQQSIQIYLVIILEDFIVRSAHSHWSESSHLCHY